VNVGFLFSRAVQFWTHRLKAGTVCGSENYGIMSVARARPCLASAFRCAGAIFYDERYPYASIRATAPDRRLKTQTFSTVRAGQTDILIWPYFFRRYGQLEKTRPRAIASPPSALSQVPKADDHDCRLGWSGGLRTPQVRVFEVYRYRNQNACL
jgi:hypothetical protein